MRKLFSCLLLLVALVGCAATPAAIRVPAQASSVGYMDRVAALERKHGTFDRAVMEAAALEHIAFIEANTSLRYDGQALPTIEIWPPWAIIVYAKDLQAQALYFNGTLVLPATFNHAFDRGSGMFVHEIVHYLQDINDVRHFGCYKKAEALAYNVSNQWVRAQPERGQERFYATPEEVRKASTC